MTQCHAKIVLDYLKTLEGLTEDEIDWAEFQRMREQYPAEEYDSSDRPFETVQLFTDNSVILSNSETREFTVIGPDQVLVLDDPHHGHALH